MKRIDDSKVYCANCLHCRVVGRNSRHTRQSKVEGRRVRCDAGMWWVSDQNKEKTYLFRSLMDRVIDECPRYMSMGEDDKRVFLSDIAKKCHPNKARNWQIARPEVVAVNL